MNNAHTTTQTAAHQGTQNAADGIATMTMAKLNTFTNRPDICTCTKEPELFELSDYKGHFAYVCHECNAASGVRVNVEYARKSWDSFKEIGRKKRGEQ